MLINSTQPDVPQGIFIETVRENRSKIMVLSRFQTLVYALTKGPMTDLKDKRQGADTQTDPSVNW